MTHKKGSKQRAVCSEPLDAVAVPVALSEARERHRPVRSCSYLSIVPIRKLAVHISAMPSCCGLRRALLGGLISLNHVGSRNRKKHCHSDGQLYERLWNVYNQKVLAELMPRHSPRAHKAWETTCYWRGLVRDGHATLNVRVFFRIKGRNEMVSELAANQQHAKSVAARLVRHVSREHFDGQPIKPQIEFVRMARAA